MAEHKLTASVVSSGIAALQSVFDTGCKVVSIMEDRG